MMPLLVADVAVKWESVSTAPVENFLEDFTIGGSRVSFTDARMSYVPVVQGEPQDYYWSEKWQQLEAESMAEYERGEALGFASVQDLLAWLEADDE